MSRMSKRFVLIALLTALAPLAAHAEEAPACADWTAVESDDLADLRGGLIVPATQSQAAVLGNSVAGVTETGKVTLSGNAFSGAHGITSNIVNTGNNVSIQSTMNVVIDLD